MEGFYFSFDSKGRLLDVFVSVDGATLSCLDVCHFKSFWVVGVVRKKLIPMSLLFFVSWYISLEVFIIGFCPVVLALKL